MPRSRHTRPWICASAPCIQKVLLVVTLARRGLYVRATSKLESCPRVCAGASRLSNANCAMVTASPCTSARRVKVRYMVLSLLVLFHLERHVSRVRQASCGEGHGDCVCLRRRREE